MRLRFAALPVFVFASALVLAACESPVRPFQHTAPPDEGAISAPGRDSSGVEVKVRGGPKQAVAETARLTAQALLAQGVPAAAAPAFSQNYGFTLEGLVTPRPGPFIAARIHWTLRARDGRWAGAHTQDVPGAWGGWESASPPMLAAAARAAADAGAELVLRAAGVSENAAQNAWGGVWVAPVTGPAAGPEDEHSAALRRALGPALRLALGAAGASVRDERAGASAVIKGRAEVSPAPETQGAVRVTIVWEVLNAADGESLGKAEQENILPPGNWGETAALAAAAVADALRDLARRARRQK